MSTVYSVTWRYGEGKALSLLLRELKSCCSFAVKTFGLKKEVKLIFKEKFTVFVFVFFFK